MCLCLPHLCSCVPTTLSHSHTCTHVSGVVFHSFSRSKQPSTPGCSTSHSFCSSHNVRLCVARSDVFSRTRSTGLVPRLAVPCHLELVLKLKQQGMRKPPRLHVRVSKMAPEPLVKGRSGSRGNTGFVASALQDVCLPC